MKRYSHPMGIVDPKTEKVKCSKCGIVLDRGLMSDMPCSTGTTTQSLLGDLNFEIFVWNGCASLLIFQEKADGIKRERTYFELEADQKILAELQHLVEESVYEIGSTIGTSGFYPLSIELEVYIIDQTEKGKLAFVPETKI